MTRVLTYAALIAVCAILAVGGDSVKPTSSAARYAADGAFRDGFYLGKLAAVGGQPLRPALGRWSTKQDRAMFTTGYSRGYNETLGRAETNAAGT